MPNYNYYTFLMLKSQQHKCGKVLIYKIITHIMYFVTGYGKEINEIFMNG